MGKSNAQRQQDWHERQKMFNCEEYRKKRNQKSKCIKSKTKHSKFQKETQGGTTKWKENKIAATESNLKVVSATYLLVCFFKSKQEHLSI